MTVRLNSEPAPWMSGWEFFYQEAKLALGAEFHAFQAKFVERMFERDTDGIVIYVTDRHYAHPARRNFSKTLHRCLYGNSVSFDIGCAVNGVPKIERNLRPS